MGKTTKQAMNDLKCEVAQELHINLKNGCDNGHLTSREAGYIGGNMVKKMIAKAKADMCEADE